MFIRQWLLAAGLVGVSAASAAAAPLSYFDDCVAAESSTFLRIEACTFSLKVDNLTDAQRAQVLLNRAKGYTVQSWSKQANADLAEAKRLAPDDPAVVAALADTAHFVGGRQDLAIAAYKDLLQQKGDDPATLLKLGMSYLVAKKYDLARQTFDKVLQLDPDNVEALTWRSTFYTQDKQYDLALADLDRAVAADPNAMTTRDYRAQALLYAGAFDRAIEDLNITLAAHQRDSLFRFRGIAEYLTGKLPAASEDFLHDLNIDPMYANLAAWRFFVEQRRGGDGSAELQAIITALKGRWPTQLLKVMLGQATGEEAMAAATSTPYAELRRVNESQAHAILGEWLLLKGDKTAAADHFKAARDIGLLMALDEVQARRAVIPADTVVEFTLARARLRELEP